MNTIVPCLWFADNNCEEAMHYYLDTFPNSSIDSVTYYPDEKLDEHFIGMNGKIINAEFTLNGQKFIGFDGGPTFRFTEAISFTILCKDQEELDFYWNKLSHVLESEQCGWCKDQFGLSWQIIPQEMGSLMSNDKQTSALMAMKKIIIQDLKDLAS